MENSQYTSRSYALALLALWGSQPGADGENPLLGWALRWNTSSSTYTVVAHRLLSALIEYPPSPEADQAVAQLFLTELAQCNNPIVVNLGDAVSTLCDSFYVEYLCTSQLSEQPA
jgi:hypothetical protein